MNLSRSLLAAAFVVSVCLLSGCMTSRVVLPEGMQLDFNSAAEPVNETVPKVLSSAVDSPVSRIPLSAFRSFLPLTKAATAVAAAPSGNKLYLGTDDGDIFELVWDRPSNRLSKRRILESNRPILALSLSPDGSRLAFSQYSFVGILDLIQSELSAELTLVDGRILSLAWDQTADFLALGRANGDAFVWNARDNSSRELEKYSGATSPIIGLEFHPKARALFVMERGGGLYLWRVLRTEYQLGLRDTTAEIDRALQGRMVVTIGYLPGQASALWLSADGRSYWHSLKRGWCILGRFAD
jgi:WD40 repeat protein